MGRSVWSITVAPLPGREALKSEPRIAEKFAAILRSAWGLVEDRGIRTAILDVVGIGGAHLLEIGY